MADEVFVASREKAKNAYGQNGYQGPSSDLPGQHTVMDRDFGLASDPSADAGNWQTRKVSAEPYATAHGNHKPSSLKVLSYNERRPVERDASRRDYQR